MVTAKLIRTAYWIGLPAAVSAVVFGNVASLLRETDPTQSSISMFIYLAVSSSLLWFVCGTFLWVRTWIWIRGTLHLRSSAANAFWCALATFGTIILPFFLYRRLAMPLSSRYAHVPEE